MIRPAEVHDDAIPRSERDVRFFAHFTRDLMSVLVLVTDGTSFCVSERLGLHAAPPVAHPHPSNHFSALPVPNGLRLMMFFYNHVS